MAKGKIGVAGLVVLAILSAAVLTQAESAKLNQVVYITGARSAVAAPRASMMPMRW